MLNGRLNVSTAANMVMLAGMERARGFRLDNYGVVFDVEFPSMRRSMVWSLQQLERRASTGDAKINAAASASSIQPREIYLTEITNALADAIVDHGTPIGVGVDEWLTVAARESVDRRFVPADPNDTAMTIILRIKGSDLAALRDRKLPREDARKRVEIKQY
jgi:small ligand-binding sensory domain FIST